MESTPRMPGLVDQRGEPVDSVRTEEKTEVQQKKEEKPCKTTVVDLQQVFPNTSSTQLKQVADLINQYGKDFGIDNAAKLQHFLAQAGEETYGFKSFHEYTNYRLSLLGTSKTYWSDKFNTTRNPTQDPDKKNPNDFANPKKPGYADGEKLLNYVYEENKTLGNTQSGDGWKYRGRGILQLTGRANYEKFNDFYQKNYDGSVDLLSHPELLNDDKSIGVISGLWYFKNRVLSRIDIDDQTSVKAVTKKINGGANGLPERRRLHDKAQIDIQCHKD